MVPKLMKYNPAFLGDEALIQSFVARTSELERILEVLRENDSGSNQHLLVIGPRGIRKTTLVLRTAAEIRADASLSARWYPIVYGEETYQVSSAGEFWLEALFHVGQQTDDERWRQAHEELLGERNEKRLRLRALAQLMDFADEHGKRLVLVVENLNMLFGGQIGDEDAWVLRHTLMNEPRIMLIGTATSRFREMDEYNQALYELFRIIELEPLADEETQAVWTAASGQVAPRSQLRPIQILTGGNPRLIRILSEFAAKTSFRSLMDDLTRLVDEHTEYFKHHLDNLPPQERKVFVVLADLWDPSTARQVAEVARLDVNVASAQLKRLVDRGAVTTPKRRGRAQFYQVAERMYNIYHLMRRRGQPSSRVHAVVRFMVSLYREEELVRTTRSLVEEAASLTQDERREHFAAYEAILTHAREPHLAKKLIEATRQAFETMADVPSSVLRLIDAATRTSPDDGSLPVDLDVQKVDDVPTLLRIAALRLVDGHVAEGLGALDRALSLDAENALGWTHRGLALCTLGQGEEALKSFDRALAVNGKLVFAWLGRSASLSQLGRVEEALEASDRGISLDAENANAWTSRGLALYRLGRAEEALESLDRSISLGEKNAFVWATRSRVLLQLTRVEEALESSDRAVSLDGEIAIAWTNRGFALGELGREQEALESFDRALALDSEFAPARVGRISRLLSGGRIQEALESFERLLTPASSVTPSNVSAGEFNTMAWVMLLRGPVEKLPVGENWARRAIEQDPENGSARYTLACILGAQARWGEALSEAAVFLRDRELLESDLDSIIRLFIAAIASGHGDEVSRVILTAGAEDAFEPLLVAIRRLSGEEVDIAREIVEISTDVIERVETLRRELREG